MAKNWESIQIHVERVSAFIAVTLNSFLIVLIVKKSPRELGAYKYLMITISVLEISYAISDVLVSPIIHHTGFTFLVISRLNTYWGASTQLYLTGVYCGLFGSMMAMFGIHFIYRYLVVKGSRWLSTFKSRKAIFWFFIPIFYGVTWGLIGVLFCGPRALTNQLIEKDILEKLDLFVTEITYIAPNFFKENGDYYWPAIIGLSVDCLIIASSTSTVFTFCFLCFRELKKLSANNETSGRNKALQKQLYYALITQTAIPLIMLQTPVFLLFMTVFCPVEIGEISGLVSICIAIYPAIDPLPTMLILTSYRKAIGGYADTIWKRVTCSSPIFIARKQREQTCF